MLGFDPRAARVTWTIFLVALILYLVFLARHTLVMFILALFFAYTIYPLVNLIDRYTPKGFSRLYSLILVYVLLIALLSTAGAWLFTNVADEAVRLGQHLPELVKEKQKMLTEMPLPGWLAPIRQQVANYFSDYAQNGADQVLPILKKTGASVMQFVGSLGILILVPILSFMMLKDANEMRQNILRSIESGPYRRFFDGLIDDLDFLLARYIRSLVLLAMATLTVYSIFFQIVGVPYGFLLAGVAALLEFIPFLGPLSAAALALLVSATNGYPHLVWLLFFFLGYRMFQDYVLSPYLMSEGIELHPLLVILGALAGEQVGGVMGMFLSVPVLAAARVLLVRIRKLQQTPFPAAAVAPPPVMSTPAVQPPVQV